MPKNTLDVESLRRRSPSDVLEDFSQHRQVFEELCKDSEAPPCAEWELPNSVATLSGEELTDAMYMASQLYGHYRRLEMAADQLQKGITKSTEVLAAALRRGVYRHLAGKEQSDAVLLDTQYEKAQGLIRDLSYLLGNVSGESKRWHNLRDTFSRDFERRKEETPRTPKRNYPKPPTGALRTKKSR